MELQLVMGSLAIFSNSTNTYTSLTFKTGT